MNNAPPAARMPAAGTQALLSIRPGGQRLAAREVLAGRDRLERLAPGHGERLATRLPVWGRSSRRPSAAVHVLSAHRAAPKSGMRGHIADVGWLLTSGLDPAAQIGRDGALDGEAHGCCLIGPQRFQRPDQLPSRSDVPSLCPASTTSRYDVWSMPGPRARASSSRKQSDMLIASAGTACTGWSLSIGVRQRPSKTGWVIAHLVTQLASS